MCTSRGRHRSRILNRRVPTSATGATGPTGATGAFVGNFQCTAGSYIVGFTAGQPVCSALPDIIFLQGFGTNIPNFKSLDMDTAAIVNEPPFAMVQGDVGWDGNAIFGPLVPSPGAGAPSKSVCQAISVYPPQNAGTIPFPLRFYCVKTSPGRYGYMQYISGSFSAAVVNWTTWQ